MTSPVTSPRGLTSPFSRPLHAASPARSVASSSAETSRSQNDRAGQFFRERLASEEERRAHGSSAYASRREGRHGVDALIAFLDGDDGENEKMMKDSSDRKDGRSDSQRDFQTTGTPPRTHERLDAQTLSIASMQRNAEDGEGLQRYEDDDITAELTAILSRTASPKRSQPPLSFPGTPTASSRLAGQRAASDSGSPRSIVSQQPPQIHYSAGEQTPKSSARTYSSPAEALNEAREEISRLQQQVNEVEMLVHQLQAGPNPPRQPGSRVLSQEPSFNGETSMATHEDVLSLVRDLDALVWLKREDEKRRDDVVFTKRNLASISKRIQAWEGLARTREKAIAR